MSAEAGSQGANKKGGVNRGRQRGGTENDLERKHTLVARSSVALVSCVIYSEIGYALCKIANTLVMPEVNQARPAPSSLYKQQRLQVWYQLHLSNVIWPLQSATEPQQLRRCSTHARTHATYLWYYTRG